MLFKKKTLRISLNIILAGIVSAISFIGFKKGVELVNDKLEDK